MVGGGVSHDATRTVSSVVMSHMVQTDMFVRMWDGNRSYEVITQRRRMREAKELFYGLINGCKERGSMSVYERNMPLM